MKRPRRGLFRRLDIPRVVAVMDSSRGTASSTMTWRTVCGGGGVPGGILLQLHGRRRGARGHWWNGTGGLPRTLLEHRAGWRTRRSVRARAGSSASRWYHYLSSFRERLFRQRWRGGPPFRLREADEPSALSRDDSAWWSRIRWMFQVHARALPDEHECVCDAVDDGAVDLIEIEGRHKHVAIELVGRPEHGENVLAHFHRV